jgi:hypothetical protein
MKKLINIFIAFAILLTGVISCQKEDVPAQKEENPTPNETVGGINSRLVGEWHLFKTLSDGIEVNQDIDVYLSINADCSFELYQKSGTQSERYFKYTGTCSSEDDILSGKYSDGMPWGAKYTFKFILGGMLLESYNMIEIQHYNKAAIPDEVKAEATLITTRSAVFSGTPIL